MVARPARHHLRERLAGLGHFGQQLVARFDRHRLGLVETVGEKYRLQLAHDRTGQPRHQLLVGEPPVGVRIDDVLRTDVADLPVDDGDLAVVAQVEAHRLAAPKTRRHQQNRLHALSA